MRRRSPQVDQARARDEVVSVLGQLSKKPENTTCQIGFPDVFSDEAANEQTQVQSINDMVVNSVDFQAGHVVSRRTRSGMIRNDKL